MRWTFNVSAVSPEPPPVAEPLTGTVQETNNLITAMAGLAMLLAYFMLPPVAIATQSLPTLHLFTTPVVESIKHTSEVSNQLETDLTPIIQRMEQQQALFEASNCQDSEADKGCQAIRKELSETYKALLETMETKFAQMAPTIDKSKNTLGKRLYSEVGLKSSPRDIQKQMGKSGRDEVRKRRSASGGRTLSKRFHKYYELVSLGSRKAGNGSMAAVASETYLDLSEVSGLVGMIRGEIAHSQLLIEMGLEADLVSDRMFATTAAVKSIIFGEEAQGGHLPSASTPETFISPLAL